MSAVNTSLVQFTTGYSTAAARNRDVRAVSHAVSNPPPLPPVTYSCAGSAMPRATSESTAVNKSSASSLGYVLSMRRANASP